MKKYFIDTLGCYPSRIDAKRTELFLKENGWAPSRNPEEADIIIVNTCAFSKGREEYSVQTIEKYKNLKGGKTKLIIGGCLPVINKRRMLTVFKGPYFTPHTLSSLCKIIKAKHCNIDNTPTAQPTSPILADMNKFICKEKKVFSIRIGYGCLNRCSFCAINKVFPKLISKNRDQIVKEFKSGLRRGYRNFILTGEDPSAYGLDIGTNLIELLRDLIKIKTRKKISISLYRLNPQWLIKMDSELIEILKSKKINYLNISVQSGSNRIIKLMNRRYDANEIKKYIKKIKKMFPSIIIHQTLMVGFPGETEKDFQATLKFVSETSPDYIRIHRFSAKPGTKAKYLGKKISPDVMRKRARRLYKIGGLEKQRAKQKS